MMQPNGLAPNDVVKHEVTTGTEMLLKKEEAEDLLSGRRYWAVYGRGEYEDIFGEIHWFHYCNWIDYYGRGGTFYSRTCVAYNDTGDGMLTEVKHH
jgi:hypothetical protein